ncbi:uncharacterized protein LOC144745821 isoform X2 [Ciona intestinalis]
MSSSSKKRENSGKINYFQQFPKDFLRPYGVATLPRTATDEDFKMKLKNFTCEWFTRPGIALSELTETTTKNWERISNDLSDISFEPFFTEFGEIVKRIIKHMDKIEKETEVKQTAKQIKILLSSLKKKGELYDSYIDSFIHIGASMFSMGLHLKAAKYVSTHIDHVSKQCFEGNNLTSFLENPSLATYAEAAAKDIMHKSTVNESEKSPVKTLKDLIAERKKRKLDIELDDCLPSTSKKRM